MTIAASSFRISSLCRRESDGNDPSPVGVRGNRRPVRPLNLDPVYVISVTEPEMQRIGVLRTVGISVTLICRCGAAAVVMDCDADADR